jgi:hypothetical protein
MIFTIIKKVKAGEPPPKCATSVYKNHQDSGSHCLCHRRHRGSLSPVNGNDRYRPWGVQINHLQYSPSGSGLEKKSARWVPKLLSDEQKLERIQICSDFVAAVHR